MKRLFKTILAVAIAATSTCACLPAEPSKDTGTVEVHGGAANVQDDAVTLEAYYTTSSTKSPVIEKGFVWGSDSNNLNNQGVATSSRQGNIMQPAVIFNLTITSLQSDTKYYFQPYVVVRQTGVPVYSYGDVATFTTGKMSTPTTTPVVTTGASSNVTTTGATLSGSFTGAPQAPREVGFEWGTSSTSLNNTVQADKSFSATSGSFTASLTGLQNETTYYYRAYILVMKGSEAIYTYGVVNSFKTSAAPSTTVSKNTWFETPLISDANGDGVDDRNSDLYYASHTFKLNGQQMRNYTVCFSGRHHCPVWVAAPRHEVYRGSQKRTDNYTQDPSIPSSLQYYSKSVGGDCNKGHMLGSAERTCCKEANDQVFYYSNIAPQLQNGYNQSGGGWNNLEDWVDKWECADTLYQVVGCYFDTYTDGYGYTVKPETITFGGRDDVTKPTMFYAVLLCTKSGNSGKSVKDCSASELKCAAFVRSHTSSLKGQKVSSKEMMSVSDLEKITGVTYFPNVPNAPKSSVNASDWGL